MLMDYLKNSMIVFFSTLLGSVDISSLSSRRPAACPRDPEILFITQVYCAEIDRTGSRGQAAGRWYCGIVNQNLKCQQTLMPTYGF
jgi:hypothetical protein